MKENARFGEKAVVLALWMVLSVGGISCSSEELSRVPDVPVKGKVTMVDVGAKECIPCKMMTRVMEERQREHHDTGRAAVFFIDV